MSQHSQQSKQIKLPDGFLTPATQALYRALNNEDATTRFVGGCVRDAVLGHTPYDLDFATTLTPENATTALKKAGFKVEPTGIDHGTIMAIKEKETFEVTTLRRDERTDGRHATVAFTTDFREDAARRDFTFNALFMDNTGQITDYFGGLNDLNKGMVRFVGTPAQRLAEDWLRALRYVRFYGRFGDTPPDDVTFAALAKAAPELQNLSAERITTEVLKTMVTPKAAQALALMDELGYFSALGLPGFSVAQVKTYCQHYPQTTDPLILLMAGVWQNPLATSHNTSPNALKNPLPNPLLATPHLRFSKKQQKLLQALSPTNTAKLKKDNIPYSCWLLGGQIAAQLWRYISVFCPDGFGLTGKDAQQAAEKAAATTVPPFPLKGADMAQLGYKKGAEMGRALKKTEEWWAENGFPDKGACLDWIRNNQDPKI